MPTSWEVNQEAFEGEGGLHNPSAIQKQELAKGDAVYETPACSLQYRITLQAGSEQEFRFIFGPASDENEIAEIRKPLFQYRIINSDEDGFTRARKEYASYIEHGQWMYSD